MFKCIISQGYSHLYQNDNLILCQPLANQCLEVIRDDLVFKLVKSFFLGSDGEALAEFKAVILQDYMLEHLPQGIKFEIEDELFEQYLARAITALSPNMFEDYCGQGLYIQTLQAMLAQTHFWNSS
jgi:hypothetical protein